MEDTKLEVMDTWQTKARGTNGDEYQIYLKHADDGTGHELGTGKPMKTFEEWLGN